jgi:hypothetical protein
MQKKRLEIAVDPDEVKEHEGYKLGQTVHCFRFPDKQPCRGEITKIHLGESVGPYHTFICEVSGQFRKALFSDTMSEPTKQMREAVEKAIAKARKNDRAIEAKIKSKEK